MPSTRDPVILAINPGSSSLKVAVRTPELLLEIGFDRLGSADGSMTVRRAGDDGDPSAFDGDLPAALRHLSDLLADNDIRPAAVVHRVVHGGPDHLVSTVIDDDVVDDLRAAVPLAPLHLPGDLTSIATARAAWPDAVHIACFDTAFHADLPETSRRLPVAAELAARGVRRYGFHGLSVQSVLRARPDLGQAVVAHLGSGCSVTAVADGRSRHTTMSLTPTGGIMSATRAGDLDPEIVLYLIEECGYAVGDLREVLDRRSGLAGLSGGRHDVRDLLAAEADDDDEDARLSLDVFVHQVASAVATCALTLDRFDTLVFTGGVGEHAAEIRRRVALALLHLRGTTSTDDVPDPVAALGSSGIRVLVVPADEQAVMDDEARKLLAH
jgi:acetate kinase